ncbi:hypothetical protein ACKKBF_B41050 [Auxenochlorella protothecoides x Auxenochlorella symbiontica]
MKGPRSCSKGTPSIQRGHINPLDPTPARFGLAALTLLTTLLELRARNLQDDMQKGELPKRRSLDGLLPTAPSLYQMQHGSSQTNTTNILTRTLSA